MTVLKQRFIGELNLPNGGWTHYYDLFDGKTVVGTKSVHRLSRDTATAVSYQLGDNTYLSAADFIAAYQERKSTT